MCIFFPEPLGRDTKNTPTILSPWRGYLWTNATQHSKGVVRNAV